MNNFAEENWLTKTPGSSSKPPSPGEQAQRKPPLPADAPAAIEEEASTHNEGLGRDV